MPDDTSPPVLDQINLVVGYAVVEDPDGNSVGLMSPVDPARRTPPPTPPG